MKDEHRAYALWLLPDEPAAMQLETLIGELSERFGTPRFAPHATLCSGIWSGDPSVLAAVSARIAAALPPVRADTFGADGRDAYFQFFYIALLPDTLDIAVEEALRTLPSAHLPEAGPHVSLMYGDAAAGIDRGALADELADRIPPKIVFGRVALVFPGGNDWREIAKWKTECIFKMTGTAL